MGSFPTKFSGSLGGNIYTSVDKIDMGKMIQTSRNTMENTVGLGLHATLWQKVWGWVFVTRIKRLSGADGYSSQSTSSVSAAASATSRTVAAKFPPGWWRGVGMGLHKIRNLVKIPVCRLARATRCTDQCSIWRGGEPGIDELIRAKFHLDWFRGGTWKV